METTLRDQGFAGQVKVGLLGSGENITLFAVVCGQRDSGKVFNCELV